MLIRTEKGFRQGDLYTDVPMSNVAIARFQSEADACAPRVAATMPVNKPSGLYTTFTMADLMRDEVEPQAPHAPASVGRWRTGTARYDTHAEALAYMLNDIEQAASDIERDPAVWIPRVLAKKALIRAERRLGLNIFKPGVWRRNLTGVTGGTEAPTVTLTTGTRDYWNDDDTDVAKAIAEEQEVGLLASGTRFNALICGAKAFRALAFNAQVRATFRSLTGQVLQKDTPLLPQDVARSLGIERVDVSRLVYNSAVDGVAATNGFILTPEDALFYFRPAGAADDPGTYNNDEPVAFAQAIWGAAAGPSGMRIREFRDEKAGPGGSNQTQLETFWDYLLISSECGVYFDGITNL